MSDSLVKHVRSKLDPNSMTFGEHLEDLRRRIILGLAGLAPIFILSLTFGKHLLALLIAPVQAALQRAGMPAHIIATNPVETFGAYVRVATIVTLVIGAPWAIYQLWLFIAPGLYRHERRVVRVVIPMSGVLGVVGVTFLYIVIMPVILAFFISFGSDVGLRSVPTGPAPEGVALPPPVPVLTHDLEDPAPGQMWVNSSLMQLRVAVVEHGGKVTVRGSELTLGSGVVPQYRVSEYVKMFFGLAMAFAVGFQTPIIVLLLGWGGIVTPQTLGRYRRHAILIICIVCAVLTPPDPFSMLLLAAPLYILFELGAVLLRMMPLGASRRETDDEAADHDPDRPDAPQDDAP